MNRIARSSTVTRLLTCVILVVALGTTAAAAQDWAGRGRIQGVVLDQDNNKIPEATITLKQGPRGEGGGPPSFKANGKGRWSYLGLANGPWTVIIEKEGFLISEGVARVSEFGQGGREQLQTILKAEGSEAAAATLSKSDQAAAAEAQAKADAMNSSLREAATLAQGGDAAGSIKAYEALLPEASENVRPQILNEIARLHTTLEQGPQAISALERALALDADNVDSLRMIASVLVLEGRSDEAQVYQDRLPEGAKLDPNAMLNIGIEKFNGNDLDGALEQFNQVVADFPEFSEVYYYRGLTHLNQGKNDEAVADFEKLLTLDPNESQAAEATEFLKYLKPE